MPDSLYDADILEWSEQQAALLRRVAAGERVNGLDWENLVEEVESVGASELNACKSLLRRALIHLLKVQGWPDCLARSEIPVLLSDARDRFAPSMRQRLDLDGLYDVALRAVRDDGIDGRDAGPLADACPFTLDDLVLGSADVDALLAELGSSLET